MQVDVQSLHKRTEETCASPSVLRLSSETFTKTDLLSVMWQLYTIIVFPFTAKFKHLTLVSYSCRLFN